MGLLDDLEFLKQQRKPNLLADVQQLQRPAEPYLRQQYPEVYGALGGLLGMAPDEMAGSILDPNTARVRAGAEYGFPVGTATQVVPALNLMKPAVAAGARALGPTAVRMGEGYLQRQGLMPGVVEGESAGMLGGPIKPQAPVSPMGFYSAAEQAALNLPRKSGTGESFLNDLMKGQDVKKEELSWLGLDDYLKGKPNVTRQEVQDFIAGNKVDVQERQLGAAVAEDPVGIASRKAVFDKYEPQIQALEQEYKLYNDALDKQILEARNKFADAHAKLNTQGRMPTAQDYAEYILADEELKKIRLLPRNRRDFNEKQNALFDARDAEANAAYVVPEPTPTKYQQYQLPGGENYREILLTLPGKPMDINTAAENYYTQFLQRGGQPDWSQLTSAQKQDLISSMPDVAINAPSSPQFSSGHFNEPNILAHMRVNDRVDADGKKMLLIEEIQSDWHQAGREKGYNKKLTQAESNELRNLQRKEQEEDGLFQVDIQRINELEKKSMGGVPDAPFKDTWHQLALKRALKYAADNGYDRVGLTTGKQQAERYDLSKQVDELLYKKNADGTYQLSAQANGRGNMLGESIPENKLSDYVGKEVATKIAENSGRELNLGANNRPKDMWKGLSGLDLQVGGEGMKKYYDEIYPAFLAKQGKKYNAKTGETRIKTGKNLQDEDFVGAEQRISEALGDYGERGYRTTDNRFFDTYADAVSHEKKISSKEPFDAPIRYIDISPKMRGGVKKGQPLFTAAPIGGIGLGAGMQDNEMPEAVRQYMANPVPSLLQDEDERKLGGLLYR